GDSYLTKRFDLTDDLDTVYGNLRAFRAEGGGDTPEHVGMAVGEAVKLLSWSQDPRTAKMIFLVGDAPAHDDYQDEWNTSVWAKKAIEKGIVVNTIRCGGDRETELAFRAISKLADGSFISIEQGGGMVAVATPYDAEVAKLSAEVATKTLYGGSVAAREENVERGKAVSAAPPAAVADRSAFLLRSKGAGGKMAPAAVGGAVDLLDAPAKVNAFEDDQLPAELQKLSKKEQQAKVEQLAGERKQLQEKISKLSTEREAWLSKNAAPKADSFDAQVMESVKKQAADVGVAYH
ncbi:MAG: vWA domain-containing protein, partial [Myxococcaceae bacterium]